MIISSVNGRQLVIISGFKNGNGTIFALVCTDKGETFRMRVNADGSARCHHEMRHNCQCWHVLAVKAKTLHFGPEGLIEHPDPASPRETLNQRLNAIPASPVCGELNKRVIAPATSAPTSQIENGLLARGLMR